MSIDESYMWMRFLIVLIRLRDHSAWDAWNIGSSKTCTMQENKHNLILLNSDNLQKISEYTIESIKERIANKSQELNKLI